MKVILSSALAALMVSAAAAQCHWHQPPAHRFHNRFLSPHNWHSHHWNNHWNDHWSNHLLAHDWFSPSHDLFEDDWHPFGLPEKQAEPKPAVLVERELANVNAPDFEPSDVHVRVEGNHLRIRGEKTDSKDGVTWSRSFEHSVSLPEGTDLENIRATLNDGKLSIKHLTNQINEPANEQTPTKEPHTQTQSTTDQLRFKEETPRHTESVKQMESRSDEQTQRRKMNDNERRAARPTEHRCKTNRPVTDEERHRHAANTQRAHHTRDQQLRKLASVQLDSFEPDDLELKPEGDKLRLSGRHVCSCDEPCVERSFSRLLQLPGHSHSLRATLDDQNQLEVYGVLSRVPNPDQSLVKVEGKNREQRAHIPCREPQTPSIKLKKMRVARKPETYVSDSDLNRDFHRRSNVREQTDDDVSIEVVE